MRCISEEILDKFGPNKAILIRINPSKGIPSVYGINSVNFIEEQNYNEKILNKDLAKNEIYYIQNTAL